MHVSWAQVLGHGVGKYNPANASLNLVDPPFRDSYTVFKGGWTVIRFIVSFSLSSPLSLSLWLVKCLKFLVLPLVPPLPAALPPLSRSLFPSLSVSPPLLPPETILASDLA
jgi:Multicopper oxidase